MAIFVISVLVIALVIAAMAVGVLAGRAPIKGSCGGLGAMGMAATCEICGGDQNRCDVGKGGADPGVKRRSIDRPPNP